MGEEEKIVDGFDFGDCDVTEAAEQGIDIEVIHPFTKEPTGGFITIVGQDSERYREAQDEAAKKSRKRQFEGARPYNVPSEERLTEIELAVGITIGWHGIKFNTKEFPFSSANARMLYSAIERVRRQVLVASRDRSRFLRSDRE